MRISDWSSDVCSSDLINGMIDGVDRALALIDDRTVVVPGHGPLSNRAELIAYGKMLRDLRARVAALKQQGKSLDEVIAAKLTANYDAVWAGQFIKIGRAHV